MMVALVVFMFWQPLFAGGTLVPHDQAETHAPFVDEPVEGLTVEVAPTGSVGVHGYWSNVGEALRNNTLSWWDSSVVGGLPTMRNGFAVFNVVYLVAPAWFAPGLVAALAMSAALLGLFGFMRSRGRSRPAALTAAVAYSFSGFFVVWIGWPHGLAAAVVPWLFWAVEVCLRHPRRRGIAGVAIAVAALLWAGSFVVAIWAIVGALAWRVAGVGDGVPRRQVWERVGLGMALGAVMSAPHLVASVDYWRWADTSGLANGDTSAPVATSLTTALPSAWGNDALGSPWFGESSFQLANVHVGMLVTVLAIVGLIAGWRIRDRSSLALSAVGALAFAVAFVGGPFDRVSDLLTLSAGEATHARVLLVLVLAVLAGDGIDAVVDGSRSVGDLKNLARLTLRGILLVAVVASPALWQLFDASRGAGALRSTLADATVPLLAVIGAVFVVRQLVRRTLDPPAAGAVLMALVAFEVLFFATPIPTTTARHERIHETAGHRTVRELLGESTRIGASGQAFFPGTNAAYGIDDIRGPGLRSRPLAALTESLEPVDGPSLDVGVARALGIGVWVQPGGEQNNVSPPPGKIVAAAGAVMRVDPALQPRVGHVQIPENGLRAVSFDLEREFPASVEVHLRGAGGDLFRRILVPAGEQSVSVALAAETLEPGADVAVTIRVEAEPGTTSLGVDGNGEAVIGVVGGDNFSHLVLSDGLALTAIANASLVRVAGSAVVEHDAGQIAALLSHRGGLDSPAVVETEIGLPGDPEDGEHTIVDSTVDGGSVSVRVVQSTNGLVVVAINDYPGWHASVDGSDAKIVRADGAFMGVFVPAGDHVVELRYSPRLWRTTALVALLAGLLAIAMWFDGRSLDPSAHHEAGSVQRRG